MSPEVLRIKIIEACIFDRVKKIHDGAEVDNLTMLTGILSAAQLYASLAPKDAREDVVNIFKATLEGLLVKYNEDAVNESRGK